MSSETPIKIGLVTGEFPPMQGGVGDYTHALASALAALNTEVHVITSTSVSSSVHRPACHLPRDPSTSSGRGVKPAEGASVSFHPSHEAFILHPSIHHWSFSSLLLIRHLAHSLNLDVLNIQYQAAAYGLSAPIHFLPQVAGIKTVVTFHDLRIPYLFPKAGKLREAAVTHLARTAMGVIANDPADEVELRRRGIKRVIRVPIGSNIAPTPPADYDRAAWRAQMGVAPQEFLIGYFGFLNESKGGDTLINALAALTSRKARVKLVLIGGETGTSDADRNAAFNAEIERLIARYDLTDRVIRTGFVTSEAVSAYLLACDAILLPYRDGVSFRRGSLMAALAHGCAIVTTHPATPLPDLQDGANVRLVPPDSASALVLAVTELLDAPDFRARLGQGAQKLSALFSWEEIARRTLEFYRSL